MKPDKIFLVVLLVFVAVCGWWGFFLWTTRNIQTNKTILSSTAASDFGRQTFGSLLSQWRQKPENRPAEVLNLLKEEFEFCQLVKDEISFGKSEFWLICNGRPFYTLYQNGSLTYELNGWGFLKDQPEVLKELQENNCRLYQATDEKILGFICDDGNLRKYTFTTPEFQFTKQKEEPFLNEIYEDQWRSTVFPCEITNMTKGAWENESFLEMTMSCQNYQTKGFFNFDKLAFSLPVVVDESLSDEEKVRQSIDLLHLHFCNPADILKIEEERFTASFECPKTGQLTIEYDLNAEIANFLFNRDDFDNLFFYVGAYIFPFLEDKRPELLGETKDDLFRSQIYSIGHQLIVARTEKESSLVSQVNFKIEEIK